MSDRVTIPGNVIRFEAALYLSLLLDTLSAASQAIGSSVTDPETYGAVNIINAVFILVLVFVVGIAARRRKNWARILLLVGLVLATFSLMAVLSSEGLSFTSAIDMISIGVTAYGMRCAFTGDARGWFTG